jgi:hypothetical protein
MLSVMLSCCDQCCNAERRHVDCCHGECHCVECYGALKILGELKKSENVNWWQGDQMIGKNSPNFFISSQNINIKPLETFEYLTTNHVLKLLTQVKM